MIDVALIGANVDKKYIKMLKTQIDKENLKFDGEDLIGLTDTITKLQSEYPKMFGEVKKMGAEPTGDPRQAPLGERAKLIKQYEETKSVADKLAIQRKLNQLKE